MLIWSAMAPVSNANRCVVGARRATLERSRRFCECSSITASTAAHKTVPNQSVYSGTKFAVRAISEGLRQEAGDQLRVTIISPGFVRTNFAQAVTSPEVKAQLEISRDRFAIPPDAIAHAVAFAIEQLAHVDVNEIVIHLHALGACQSQDVCERVILHL